MIQILVNYETGNSFGHHTEEEILPLSFNDMGKARDALLAIKEHYELYNKLNAFWPSPTPQEVKRLVNEAKKKLWFVDNGLEPRFCFDLKLKTDDGEDYQFHAFWCGYFERLHYAEIIDGRNRIEFDA